MRPALIDAVRAFDPAADFFHKERTAIALLVDDIHQPGGEDFGNHCACFDFGKGIEIDSLAAFFPDRFLCAEREQKEQGLGCQFAAQGFEAGF